MQMCKGRCSRRGVAWRGVRKGGGVVRRRGGRRSVGSLCSLLGLPFSVSFICSVEPRKFSSAGKRSSDVRLPLPASPHLQFLDIY
ncbi:hypothetical protein E2C01_088738 [Portunus trituberculatus]|uniref:Uncharacterized protein n=1 Tax=Portunus trituberculatus TaxID=210409 RepID=A0A5B7JMP8_PORTR|nr:hypothetical protein [Portunus trituberculatus]